MSATWIADALRARGLTVDESQVPDWKSRTHTDGPTLPTVVGVMGHHTAGGAGNLPSLGTVRDGRTNLAGPLANLMLARDGTWVPIAAGRCYHAGAADNPGAWPWVPNGDANGYVLGVEAESAGTVDDWTAAQRESYPRGVAALLAHQGLGAGRFLGHKEWAPSRKVDPAFWDMGAFRATVAQWLTNPQQEDDMFSDTDRWALTNTMGAVGRLEQSAFAEKGMLAALATAAAAGTDLTGQQVHDAAAAGVADGMKNAQALITAAVVQAVGADNQDVADKIVKAIAAALQPAA